MTDLPLPSIAYTCIDDWTKWLPPRPRGRRIPCWLRHLESWIRSSTVLLETVSPEMLSRLRFPSFFSDSENSRTFNLCSRSGNGSAVQHCLRPKAPVTGSHERQRASVPGSRPDPGACDTRSKNVHFLLPFILNSFSFSRLYSTCVRTHCFLQHVCSKSHMRRLSYRSPVCKPHWRT